MTLTVALFITAILLLISIVTSKLSTKYGVPALLIFLGIGMLFGSDGLEIIYFDDFQAAQSLGIIALLYILFSGGLDTDWKKVKPIAGTGMILSTIGVLVSATSIGVLQFLYLTSKSLKEYF